MSINLDVLRNAFEISGYPFFRDKAPKKTKYPYIVYSFISKERKTASSKTFRRLPLYQVSLFSEGTEKDLEPLEKALESLQIPFTEFVAIQGDENDETITNYYMQVRVFDDGS